ncbi:Hypothetical protein NTJ_04105 [Nesidiocoris tenuis]|uniref:Uncharacterized protein n=1 Tax=Nesidiocoris tenuis TaxID=355587 RepID=A0ABN7ALT6_9HEMI|nr:Hypothetical protein NTJ_04105 [Nesidiocoris tenuis]
MRRLMRGGGGQGGGGGERGARRNVTCVRCIQHMARGRAGSRSRGGELASVGFNDLRKPPLGEKRRHSSTPLVAIAADAACLSLTARTNRRAADDRVSGELKSGGSRSAGTHSLAETVRPAREMSRLGDHRRGPRLGRLCHGFQVQAEAPPTGRRSAKSASPSCPAASRPASSPPPHHLTTSPFFIPGRAEAGEDVHFTTRSTVG